MIIIIIIIIIIITIIIIIIITLRVVRVRTVVTPRVILAGVAALWMIIYHLGSCQLMSVLLSFSLTPV